MLVGVISDTHDRLPAVDAGLAALLERDVEVIIHPGDIIAPFAARKFTTLPVPVHVTYGNNDGERAGLKSVLPQIVDGPLFVELGGRNILVHHFIDWCDAADVAKADVIITGHTHAVSVERRDGKLFLNPGEACGWVNGVCTVATLETETLEVDIIELDVLS